MARVCIESLVKRFGTTTAVDDVSIDISDCEFLAMVGPSGCGKSSTLRIVSGLEKPTAGRVMFDGRDVTRLSPDQRDVAMVFQSYALYPHMSVRRNLAFPLENMRLPRTEIESRVAKAAEMLGIGDLLDRRPRQLSGGQRQRVALGRAVVRNAAVFLLDEPLSNLDAQLRVSMRSELKRLHGELKQTFIYVTHDQAEAMTMADRIAVMADGKLQQLGTPDDIYFRPANRFVAKFMGTPAMNFLSGRLTVEGGRSGVLVDGTTHTVSVPESVARWTGPHEVTLGVRPEAIELVPPGNGCLTGVISLVEPLHPDIFVTVEVGGQALVLRTGTGDRPTVGQRVDLHLTTAALHVFAATGERIGAEPVVPVGASAPVDASAER
jgi:ABC-type sugar transport system ATPase subunit